jgi:hypothetical protein
METRGGHGVAVVPEDAPELGTDSGQRFDSGAVTVCLPGIIVK